MSIDTNALATLLQQRLDERGRTGLAAVLDKVRFSGKDALLVHFASLPRRVGKDHLFEDLAPYRGRRAADLAALLVLAESGATPPFLEQLFHQGDAEERRMVLAALPWIAETADPSTIALLEAAHRSNDQVLFETGLLDHDLPARVLPDASYWNVVQKAAFLDLPIERLIGAEQRAGANVSAMLLDFMSEREAAGRPVWESSLILAALAPVPGVVARVCGDLWHGRDARRATAARAAAALADDPFVRRTVDERLEQERDPGVRTLLAVIGRS